MTETDFSLVHQNQQQQQKKKTINWIQVEVNAFRDT